MSSHTPLKILTVLFILATPLTTNSEPLSAPPVLDAPAKAVQSVTSSDSEKLILANHQIKILQTQLDSTLTYQGLLLDTVYWALGSVFLLVSLLLGFGWLVNFKIHEREKDTFRAEMLSEIAKISSEIETKVTKLSSILEQDIHTKIENMSATLKESLDTKAEQAIKPTAQGLAWTEKRVFNLEMNNLKRIMLEETSESLALTKALSLLEKCQSKAEDEIPDIIKFMLTKLAKGGKLTADEITRTTVVIDALPPQYKALTDRLREKLVISEIF